MKGCRAIHLSLFLGVVDCINRNKWQETSVPFHYLIDKCRLPGKESFLQARSWLVENGLLIIEPGKNGYQMAKYNLGIAVLNQTATESATMTATEVLPVSNQTATMTHYNKHKTNNKHKTVNPAFEMFWSLYDKKNERQRAEKEFAKLTQDEVDLVIDYTPKYVAATPNKQYRKNPYNFLKNKSFNDELPANGSIKRSNTICSDFANASV